MLPTRRAWSVRAAVAGCWVRAGTAPVVPSGADDRAGFGAGLLSPGGAQRSRLVYVLRSCKRLGSLPNGDETPSVVPWTDPSGAPSSSP